MAMAETMLMLQRSYRKKRLKGFKGSPQEFSFFIFTSVREYFEATVLNSFLEKVMPVFIFLLIYFTIQHLEYIQDEVRHTVRVQLVPYFCHDTAI